MADQDRIRELRNARGVAKRQLTLLEQFILGMTQETDFYVIEARFESLTRISGHFEAAQTELERLDPAEIAEPPGESSRNARPSKIALFKPKHGSREL